eukprot:TRINITY_DN39608_c0_g1_i1.p2 TRINITY_DN39608_c0_g1~~TRINITY_DN39608_c0_g1_i1.p2  ORF type:complete len:157 (+),score=57.56 TRINITY_DN39608_c0_g1_i1:50-472(+)
MVITTQPDSLDLILAELLYVDRARNVVPPSRAATRTLTAAENLQYAEDESRSRQAGSVRWSVDRSTVHEYESVETVCDSRAEEEEDEKASGRNRGRALFNVRRLLSNVFDVVVASAPLLAPVPSPVLLFQKPFPESKGRA